MWAWGRKKVTRRVDVVVDGAGPDGGAGDDFPFNEGGSVASKEVVL